LAEVQATFGKHKAEPAAEAYEQALKTWQLKHDAWTQFVQVAESFKGTCDPELMLASGESVFLKVTGAALTEDRSPGGQWKGHN
jgi:hypothetical protein